MSRRIIGAILIAVCVYLDTIFFARVNFYDIRPDALLAATVSYAVLLGPEGILFGGIGGLVADILVGPMLGMNAAVYAACGMLASVFYQKFYADNVIVPAGVAVVCGIGKELIYALITALRGARFSLGWMLLQYILPGALISALLCMLLHVILKPLLASQVKRQQMTQ